MRTSLSSPLAVIILAAGKGTRMKSALPKVLHPVAGMPMLGHVLTAAQRLNPEKIVVVTGFGAETVETYVSHAFAGSPIAFARQTEQKGTGHAVMQAETALAGFEGTVVIFSGDSMLPEREDVLPALMGTHATEGNALTVLSANVPDPKGYGRIFKDGALLVNVEEKDCDDAQRAITTVNTSFYAVESRLLWAMLPKLTPNNAQGEYYLTDIIRLAGQSGATVGMAAVPCVREEIGMNNRAEIAQMEALWQTRKRQDALMAGVTLVAPETVFFSPDTQIAADVTIHPNVVFGPGVVIETGVTVLPFCHLEGCTLKTGCRVGPFARLRPTTTVGEGSHIGNFVELKNATFGAHSNAGHLSYIGDATVGDDCNLGAVTVTANYNHVTKQKFTTTIGDRVSTGSLSVLVAPVTVADDAYIGAATAVRKPVPAHALVATTAQQIVKENYTPALKTGALPKKG